MTMPLRRLMTIGLSLAYVVVSLCLPLLHTDSAKATNVGWLVGGTPNAQYVEGLTGAGLTKNGPDCTEMTFKVYRWVFAVVSLQLETHCMITTAAGLVDSNYSVVIPHDFDAGFPIVNSAPGHPAFVPVPGQDAVLSVTSDPSGLGTDLGLYRSFSNHLHLNVLNYTYTLTDGPDLTFQYANGHPLDFNFPGVEAFTSDGSYAITEVEGEGLIRIDLLTLQIMPFAADLPIINGSAPTSAQADIDESGRYVVVSYPGVWGAPYLQITDVESCGSQSPATAYVHVAVSCASVDELAELQAQFGSVVRTGGVRMTTDHSLLVDAYDVHNVGSRYSMAAVGTDWGAVQYLAMGDSYISGEGTFDYRAGTDTNLNKCHQSPLSYPYLLASQFSSFASVACSGAFRDNVTGKDGDKNTPQLQHGVLPTEAEQATAKLGHIPGYVAQDDFIIQDNPEVVTLSIGGNDIHFSDILTRCVAPFQGDITPSTNCYDTYEDRKELVDTINSKFNDLVATYNSIKQNDSNRRVYVVGYPQVASVTGGCGDNVRLSQPERAFASELVDYFDSVIQKAAAKAGVFYVDTQNALVGHELCEPGDSAVNGLTAGYDKALVLGNESYHPNQLGQVLLGDTVAAQTHNLTAPMPVADDSIPNPTVPDTLPILQAPKAIRGLNSIIDTDDNFQTVVNRGQSTAFDYDGSGYLAPNSSGTSQLHSTPVNLGAVQVDANGNIHADFAIPADMTPGFHTIHVYVTNVLGDPVDIQKTIYVNTSASDYDGDGVANATDSCPNIPNSGHDVDEDGIDDACDPLIGEAPVHSLSLLPIAKAGITTASSPANAVLAAAAFGENNLRTGGVMPIFDAASPILRTTPHETNGKSLKHSAVLHASKVWSAISLALLTVIGCIFYRAKQTSHKSK